MMCSPSRPPRAPVCAGSFAASPCLISGKDVADRYQVLDARLGRGGSSRVFLGRDRLTGHGVALKRVYFGGASVEAAVREVQLLQRLRHSAVVELLDAFRQREEVCLVFECMHGDLARELRVRGALPETECKRHLNSLLTGLEYLSGQRIVHGDIKPSNLLIRKAPRRVELRIADFGAAFVMGSIQKCSTALPPGTAGFRAPELLMGMREPCNAGHVDMWSAGCVFAEILSGEGLVHGAATALGQLSKIATLRPASPPLRIAGIDDERMEHFTRLWRSCGGAQSPSLGETMQGSCSVAALALLHRMLEPDPVSRISPRQALHDWYFSPATRPEMLSEDKMPSPILTDGLRSLVGRLGCDVTEALADGISPPRSSSGGLSRSMSAPPSSASRSPCPRMTPPGSGPGSWGPGSVTPVRRRLPLSPLQSPAVSARFGICPPPMAWGSPMPLPPHMNM
eukprot:Hpha_TRINITY_DN16885_c0_g5::TRINITY_DN16885_c0_g5_i2::g.151152::m.151152